MMLLYVLLIITWAIILYSFVKYIRIITMIKHATYSKITMPKIKNDALRVWQTFFESYLFVYANSNSTPTDKEFLHFRDSYIQMFRLVVGEEQFALYAEAFRGTTPLVMYLRNSFEKQFKIAFIGLMIDQNIVQENFKNEKVR